MKMTPALRLHKFVWFLLALNLAYWVWFWAEAWRNANPYTDRPPRFEEPVPVYKFGGSALPVDADVNLISFQSLHVCQAPALFLVARSATVVFQRGWDERFGRLSLGAWILVVTNAVSFIQWWFIGLFILRLDVLLKRGVSSGGSAGTS